MTIEYKILTNNYNDGSILYLLCYNDVVIKDSLERTDANENGST